MSRRRATPVNVEATVRNFLKDELGKNPNVGRDESLLESGTVDSIGVMRLVAFLEATFGITVDEDDLMPDNFDTIAAIAAFVQGRQGARG
jgi:acyl carrier protein